MKAEAIQIESSKTYATRANAVKAVEAVFGPSEWNSDQIWYIIAALPDGRFAPVFIGERAAQRGIHFKFNVVA